MREERHVNCKALSIHEIHLNVPNNILQQLDAVLYDDILPKRKKKFLVLEFLDSRFVIFKTPRYKMRQVLKHRSILRKS